MTVPRWDWNKANIAAVAFLMLASLFAVYRWHYEPRTEATRGLQTIADGLRLDAIQRPTVPVAVAEDGATIPKLLAKVQEIATGHDVSLRSVTPSPVNGAQITLGMDGEFRNLMMFLARLETLRIGVSGFDITPSADGNVAATVELLHSSKPGVPLSYADYIEAIVNYSAIRNPFEIGDPVPLPGMGSDLGDISWTYHLSSISLVGVVRVATIDGKDYGVGDKVGDMTIQAIGPSSVSLRAPGQVLLQKLHFRRNPKGGTNG